ncbi:glycosyl transferase family A [Streptomyces minutiscleroticus]|uniref:Glycosyl transferase family A n=1 Tax=Streptomyces minutiscleroticus TaxID=68238 RepID=A0A918KLZ6_9ACTN|nr:CDP-glycerol:glycerophosphate glycerophosphotransferase [Streptomyces minutiscleroticus]GGX65910.1 glycosyl transferase family A [Streptomyces minutiscleroticus]
MPRFSIIVSPHGAGGRLSQALDSVLAQSFGDIEVIPVRGAPDSPAGLVAAGYAARDARVVPAPSLTGAGTTATGAYVLFLGEDDLLAPGALAAVDARLRETGGADVLHLGHERLPWWEGEPEHEAFEGPPPYGALVRTGAWAAAYRREFLVGEGLVCPEDDRADVGWTGAVTLAAGRTDAVRALCVRHRVRRQGEGPAPAALLDQVEAVLDRAAGRPLDAGRAGALFGALFAAAVEAAAGPWPSSAARRAFVRRAGRLYRRHRPAGFRPPAGAEGLRLRLLARGVHPVFAALPAAGRARERWTALAGRVLRRLRRGRPRYPYAWYLRRPVDENLAVFSAYWGRGHACNPAAVHRAARELAPHVRSVFLVREKDLEHMPEDVESVVVGSRRYWEVMARAKYTFNNVNFENAVRKRPGTVHVQTHHGTPLKRMGLDQVPYRAVAAATGSFGGLMRRVDRWDYSLSSNPHSTEVWSGAYPGSYEHLEYGYPRNDRYYTARPEEVAQIRARLGVPEGRTALLYAPTFRDYPRDVAGQFDLARFCSALGEGFVVLLRAHYFLDGSPGLRGAVESGRLIDVTSLRETEDVCLAADALITDYSSIMFDYANLDRPIVVHADDWDVYRDTRGVYFDLLAEPPGPVTRTQDELAAVFASGAWADERSAALRARFRERFCAFDDGRAAERVVRRVLLGQSGQDLPPVVPLHERTPVPAAGPVPGAPAVPAPAAAPAAESTSAAGSVPAAGSR